MAKFTKFTAATAALLIASFASAEVTGAHAEVTDPATAPAAAAAALETMPVFVSEAVVQDISESSQAEAADAPAVAAPEAASLAELVSKIPQGGALDAEMHCLAGAVYFESRGEPLDGQLAVAKTVINRAASGRFPSTYCGVVYQRAQFSFVRGRSMPAIRTGSTAWKNAVAIARIAHGDMWDSKADSSLFFHARSVKPGWSHRRTALTTISSHVFYK